MFPNLSRRRFLSVSGFLGLSYLSASAADSLVNFAGPEHRLLVDLLLAYLRYFTENQYPMTSPRLIRGLIRDRQNNFGPLCQGGVASTSATGMGCIALALACDPDFNLLSREEAVRRVHLALETALLLPHEEGIGPHFVDTDGSIVGRDKYSTIDWAWLVAGAGWAARYLKSDKLEALYARLCSRVNWQYWTHGSPSGLLRHGRHQDGSLLTTCWDRYNAEPVVMYTLATGSEEHPLPAKIWRELKPYRVNGIASGDLGLFALQLGLELFPAEKYLTEITGVDLLDEHRKLVKAHWDASKKIGDGEGFWCRSAGDAPSDKPGEESRYKESSLDDHDGTVNLTVSVASLRANPDAVLHNLKLASHERWSGKLMGRYGLSNVNLLRNGELWAARQSVGFDVGGAVMALANFLKEDLLRNIFGEIPCIQRSIQRLKMA